MFISGLTNPRLTPKELATNIYNKFYRELYNAQTDKLIQTHMINDNEKIVHNKLYDLCGEYELETIVQQITRNDIKKELERLLYFLICDNIVRDVNDERIRINGKESVEQIYTLSSNLYHNRVKLCDSLDDTLTYVVDDSKRQVKFLKYIKSILQKEFELSDEQFEKTKFVNWYNTHRVAKKQTLYLIITNSLISTVGMSSYGQTVNNKHLWTSCQKLTHPASHSAGLFQHIVDTNSLICYVTDKKPAHLYTCIDSDSIAFSDFSKDNLVNNTDYYHYQMIQRNIIRLFWEPDNKKYTIALDRSYPNNKYTKTILKKLMEITSDDLNMSVFYNYNVTQNSIGENELHELKHKFFSQLVYTPNPIPYLIYRNGNSTIAYGDQYLEKQNLRINSSPYYRQKYKICQIGNKEILKEALK